ncbi:MAG: twin-arginine translocation pathway signal protein [Anaerolineae bacterium]|nr:twin-arginine translocation pathway signal protein [Anaerolineae bacterium]
MKWQRSYKPLLSVLVLAVVLLGLTSVAFAQSGAPVDPIVVLSNTQAEDPIEFETTRLLVENMRQLGLQVEHKAVPWAQYSDTVWFNRLETPEAEGGTGWQMTAWRMVARPERMDPDEFVFNLFHSSTAESGYNFVGYINPAYDALAEAQRGETNQDARREEIFQAQELIANDVPYIYVAHPSLPQLVRTDIWDPESIVDAQGIGIQNFWTWTGMTPLGDQKTIITNTGDDLISINPLYIAGDAPSRITELVWDRLMRIGADGLAQPWAAESVEWEDETNVIIKLRSGMMWHDGEPVTVDDVKFSFEVPNSGESPMYAPFTRRITNIEILDDSTLRFTLNEPWVAFEVASLAKVNLIPKHIWEPLITDLMTKEDNAEGLTIDQAPAIGSGPFKFVDWKEGETAILEANKEHFSPPKADGWVIKILPNQESALGQIQTGELNFLREWEGDSQVLQEVADADPNITLYASPDLGFRFFAFNLRFPPFDNVALRQAVAHVMPKDSIVKNIFKGFAVPADSYVSKAIDYWHDPNLPQYNFSIDEGRQVLTDAGFTWDAEGMLHYPAQ